MIGFALAPGTGSILDLKLSLEEANFVPGTDSNLELKLFVEEAQL